MPRWIVWMLVGSAATAAFFAGVRIGRESPARVGSKD